MRTTVRRHAEYNKFIVTVDNGKTVNEFVLYDLSVSELAEFVKTITTEEKQNELLY